MSRRRDEAGERHIEQLLDRLGRKVPRPPEQELRTMARAAAETPRVPAPAADRRGWRPSRLRWGVAVAGALLLGIGFGFGFGTRSDSDGAAGTSVAGFGFLPAKGWTVVQSGAVGGGQPARAIATNVRLHAADAVGRIPLATLEDLPPHGVLIVATFTTRGDPAEDMRFAARGLPLRIAGAPVAARSSEPLPFDRRLAQYRLRAAAGGYNVDARIYFGAPAPPTRIVDAAQRQLSRLVVASERVTIAARPSILRSGQRLTVFGTVDSGRADELVRVQARECGQRFFRDVASATTADGGAWSTDFYPGIGASLRAVWNETASEQIRVQQRPLVVLSREFGRRFEVEVSGKTSFWRKRVRFERLDRRLGGWVTVKSVALGSGAASAGDPYPSSEAEFTASVRRGTLVRAVLPRSQARPCYLAGYSNLVRT
jgi:hypothetical protein